MAEKKTLDNGLIEIQAGQTVENFLKDINDNFKQIQITINGAPKNITVSKDGPIDGNGLHGDIWIQYEEE